MSGSIKTVALLGYTGNIGPHALNALVANGNSNVTVFSRSAQDEKLPNATFRQIDLASSSVESLAQEFKGHGAVADLTSIPDPTVSIRVVDAAVAASVYRFIPAEFSHSPSNVKARALPLWAGKNLVYQHLTKLADERQLC
ncbi:hypothetical protein FALBO_2597 [Fusarium albosuccineum]|uniref:NAD(P)-binding domain-containing protein n=1 Tax=Fusarium albosuccineum TaxID=1237068 RepID=A0A8H4LJ23_9HYPO|nr:hypothetical protein FALBO_2597 [Fusarium albosuccineum]